MILRRMLLTVGSSALLLAGVAGADGAQLRGSVGPGFELSLEDGSGAAVKHLDPGAFSLVVDDMSADHNFHLWGPGGVDERTEIDAVGVKTFSVTLVDGTYMFLCDAHPSRMKGTFTVGTAPPEAPPIVAPARLVLTVTSGEVTAHDGGRQAGEGTRCRGCRDHGARSLGHARAQAPGSGNQPYDRGPVRRHRYLGREAVERDSRLHE